MTDNLIFTERLLTGKSGLRSPSNPMHISPSPTNLFSEQHFLKRIFPSSSERNRCSLAIADLAVEVRRKLRDNVEVRKRLKRRTWRMGSLLPEVMAMTERGYYRYFVSGTLVKGPASMMDHRPLLELSVRIEGIVRFSEFG